MKLKFLLRIVRFSFNFSSAFHFFFFLFDLTFCRFSTRASVLRLDMPQYRADTNLHTLLATLSEQDCKLKKNNHGDFIDGIQNQF